MSATLHIHDPLCGWCYGASRSSGPRRKRPTSPSAAGGALWRSRRSSRVDAPLYPPEPTSGSREMSGQRFGPDYHNGLLLDPTMVLGRARRRQPCSRRNRSIARRRCRCCAWDSACALRGRTGASSSPTCSPTQALESGSIAPSSGGSYAGAVDEASRDASVDVARRRAGVPDVRAANRRGPPSRAAWALRVATGAVSRLARGGSQSDRGGALIAADAR